MSEPPAGVITAPTDERQQVCAHFSCPALRALLIGGLEQKLAQLFKERPVWSRLALSARLPEVLPAALKRFLPCGTLPFLAIILRHERHVLPSVGFYFVNGPWRLLWCRYGYDPTKDSSSRK